MNWTIPKDEPHAPEVLTKEAIEELRLCGLYPNAADLLATLDAVMAERDEALSYAEKLRTAARRFAIEYAREFRQPQAVEERWPGFFDGFDTKSEPDASFLQFRDVIEPPEPFDEIKPGMQSSRMQCPDCDGCGWTEGGVEGAIGAQCTRCHGKGELLSTPAFPPVEPLTGALPGGWKLVPIHPTPEMTKAALGPHATGATNRQQIWGAWNAMLDAAPVAPRVENKQAHPSQGISDAHPPQGMDLAAELEAARKLVNIWRAAATEPPDIGALVDRFLSWPLPKSVCSDAVVSMPGKPHRSGTNLLTADEARQMIEYLLNCSPEENSHG